MPARQPLAAAIVEALDHPGNLEHLEVLLVQGSKQLRIRSTGRLLGLQNYSAQLRFKCRGCKPGQQHFKCCQVQAVSKELEERGPDGLLLCTTCTPPAVLQELRVRRPAVRHASVLRWLAAKHQGVPFYLEHALGGYSVWPGLVDVYFPHQRLCLQWDGEHHFEQRGGMYRDRSGEQQRRDLEFNTRAWNAGYRVLRLHFNDGGAKGQGLVGAALRWCARHPARGLLLLSHSYARVLVRTVGMGGLIEQQQYHTYMWLGAL
jgi:very-short-patch-repair endonuclease